MVVVPGLMAFTIPETSTVATLVDEEFQATPVASLDVPLL
jgi:hypothetical protein